MTTETKTKLPKRWTTTGRLRVKRNQINNRYGVRCRNPYGHRDDNRVHPGEVAIIKTREIRGKDWAQLVRVAEFSRGREIIIAESELFSTAEPRPMPWDLGEDVQLYVALGVDLGDFVRVTVPE